MATTPKRMGNEKKPRVGIVVSSYHDFVTKRLHDGALAALSAVGVTGDAVVVASVPGAFEIPQAAGRFASEPVDSPLAPEAR